jgi:hypothetical protein
MTRRPIPADAATLDRINHELKASSERMTAIQAAARRSVTDPTVALDHLERALGLVTTELQRLSTGDRKKD